MTRSGTRARTSPVRIDIEHRASTSASALRYLAAFKFELELELELELFPESGAESGWAWHAFLG